METRGALKTAPCLHEFAQQVKSIRHNYSREIGSKTMRIPRSKENAAIIKDHNNNNEKVIEIPLELLGHKKDFAGPVGP